MPQAPRCRQAERPAPHPGITRALTGAVRMLSRRTATLALTLLTPTACVGELAIETQDDLVAPVPVTYGRPADVVLAGDLVRWASDRGTWSSFTGMEGMVPGSGAHGAFQRFRLNAVAASNPETLPSGSIIVLETYDSDQAQVPLSIAVMQKVEGYDHLHADWFWAQLDASGVLAEDENGVPLAGRMGVDREDGCIGCHATAPGDDFVYSNEVR